MPLNIKDERTHEAARELARLRGTTITEAVAGAVREALAREREIPLAREAADAAALDAIALSCASLPLRDSRSAEQILGYDDKGLPG